MAASWSSSSNGVLGAAGLLDVDGRAAVDERRRPHVDKDVWRGLEAVRLLAFGGRPSPEARALNEEIKAARNPDELLAIFDHADRALFDYFRVSMLWSRLGRASRRPLRPDSVHELIAHTIETLPSSDEQGVANILHGAAKARLRGRDAAALYEAGEAAARRVMREMAPQNLSNTAWAFAVADARCDALFGGPQFVQACERHGKSLLGNRFGLRQLEEWRQWRDACSADGRAWPTLPAPLLAACQQAGRKK